MNKQVDMSKFIGSGFDCEFTNHAEFKAGICISSLSDMPQLISTARGYAPLTQNTNIRFNYCRPRLNKPQVLDNWSWLPDGLVLMVGFSDPPNGMLEVLETNSMAVRGRSYDVVYASCIGVEESHSEWGEARGMKVVEI